MNWAHLVYMYELMAKDKPLDYTPIIRPYDDTHQEHTRIHFRKHNYLRLCGCLCCAEVRRTGWHLNNGWASSFTPFDNKVDPGPEKPTIQKVFQLTEAGIYEPRLPDSTPTTEDQKPGRAIVDVPVTKPKAPRPKGMVL